MEPSTVTVIALGFLLGMKHSLDVDHLAAVSTLVGGARSVVRSMIVGVAWGLGHSSALFVLGGAVILLDLRFPPEVSLALESLVGLMLIFLGVRVFIRLARGGVLHVHAHSHGGEGRVHIHPHIHAPSDVHAAKPATTGDGHHHGVPAAARSSRASFLIGMVHGLAGTGALTLVLLPTIRTKAAGLAYLVVFGAGSVCGMALSTALLSLPLKAFGLRGPAGSGSRTGNAVTALAGAACLGVGAVLLWETGVPLLFR